MPSPASDADAGHDPAREPIHGSGAEVASSKPDHVVALDVGGTAVKSGLVVSGSLVTQRLRTEIDPDAPADEIVGGLASIIERTGRTAGEPVDTAIAFPAPFDYAAGIPRLAHKFASLDGCDLAAALRSATSTELGRITFVNDAVAAGAGEVDAVDSAANRIMVITIGTGLGASFFVGGRPVSRHGGVTIGDLWAVALGDGTPADDAFSARGLAATLGVSPSGLADAVSARPERSAAWGRRLAEFLGPVIDSLGADHLVVAGAAGVGGFEWFGPALAEELAIPVTPARRGADGPLIGAVRAAALVSDR